jgi:stress-induced-phosphoprotein 1
MACNLCCPYLPARLQDKGDHFGFGGRGGGGGGGGSKGGDAGSRSKPGQDLAYIRHVPKFLQAHAHMLGTAVEEEPEAAALRQKYDSGGEEEGAGDDEADEQASLGLGCGLLCGCAA